ncbi:Uncharacterised protein [Vibrio cholerae]|nr:Uncharacterised protein [Vibrio cholerae]
MYSVLALNATLCLIFGPKNADPNSRLEICPPEF